MDLYRSVLFVPGSKPERIDAADSPAADAVVVDLEDGVAPEHKDVARENAIDAVEAWRSDTPLGVRVNGVDTARGVADVDALVAADAHPGFVAVPDVRGPSEVQVVAEAVGGTAIELLPLIERPSAVFRVAEIARSPRVFGLLFAAIDLQTRMGMSVLGESELSVPRSLVSMAASAADAVAIDKPLLADDPDRLAAECSQALALGYDGKLAVTPAQATAINDAFSPSEAELAEARRIIEAFEADGAGLVDVDGTFVDKPVVDQLRDLLARGEAAGRN
jgi:citrate lyase beta subunit